MKRKKIIKTFDQPERIQREKIYVVPHPTGIPIEVPAPVSVPLEQPKKGDIQWPQK